MSRAGVPCVAVALAALALSACAPMQPAEEDARDEVNVLEIQEQAAAAYDAHDWQNAERYYRELVVKVPKEADNWFRLGNIYARLNRPEVAVAAYREALVRDPANAKAWNNMGVTQLRQAANTFREMHDNVEADNPMSERGRLLFEAITRLLDRGPAVAGDGMQ